MSEVADINIHSYELLPSPHEIKSETEISKEIQELVLSSRQSLSDIVSGKDKRIAVIVGPCSIHDVESGLEYAKRIAGLSHKVSDTFLILMRVYFTKPRTTTGWKGLINDPELNDSFSIAKGLRTARRFLIEVLYQGIPAATEALDAIVPQYIDDLISWNAIGARTAESQTHREMASGLSTPVGFKNGTDGNVHVAINAMKAASTPHHFLGIDQFGRCAVLNTKGNPYTHIVLRGGASPNYSKDSVEKVATLLKGTNLPFRVLVDCSHGNSQKDYRKQAEVWKDCISQISEGESPIMGLMLESHLKAGRQDVSLNTSLEYGISITDSCIDWELTEKLILEGRETLLCSKTV
jgi:3-deoxy-7-phosphoheptulonate synthase